VFIFFECESRLHSKVDGEPLIYQVEAIVKRGVIKEFTLFVDEDAKFVDVEKLPQAEQDWILDNIHHQAAMRDQAQWEDLSNTEDHPANDAFGPSYATWINRGSR
jgi:hypothetical protein